MKALVYTGPESLEIREMPAAAPSAGETAVAVESVGICGSDMHAYLGHDDRRPAPLILGHEVAGTASNGKRVTVNPLVSCGKCRACLAGQDNLCPYRQIISMPPREGGFAEAIAIPEANLVELPDSTSADQAALAEPVACGWHAARLARQHLPGTESTRALVFGGGAIGMGAALSLKAHGFSDVTLVEPNDLRRNYLNTRGEVRAVQPEKAGQDYDAVIDGVGIAPTRAQASAAVRPGGIILHIGLGSGEGGLDIRRMTLQEITFIGTYTYTAQDFRDCAAAMFEGRLGALDWIETRALEDGARAFADIRAGQVAAPKIILKPNA